MTTGGILATMAGRIAAPGERRVPMSRLRIVWAAVLLICTAAAFGDEMSVSVKETFIRATPSFLGKVLAKLAYTDRVEVQSTQGAWAKVSFSGKQGWVSLSALSTKKYVLKAGSEDVSQIASSGEMALAGKGFNKEVEAKYKSDEKLDYTWVDRMATTYIVTPDQVAAFLSKGGLSGDLGGDR